VVDKLERVSPKTAPRQITTDEVDALELESQAAKIGADDLDAEPKIRVGEDWTAGLVIRSKKKGDTEVEFLPRISANLIHILTHHPNWSGKIAFDEFRECVVLRESPWTDYERRIEFCAGEWTEEDTVRAVAWLGRWGVPKWGGFDVPALVLDSCLPKIARENSYHPLQEYLNSLRWDANRRIDTMLSRYFGAPNTEYTRGISRCWMTSAVARVFEPGCQADYMIVLEGAQEKGKTRALEALFGTEYFSETGFNIDDKDSVQCLRGKWLHVFDELAGMAKKDVESVKNFLTRKVDNIRPSYGRRNRDYPRRCVFAATTNASEYLQDETGNRRFWPVPCDGAIDREAITADRDQLWAEALALYEGGARWYPDAALRALCAPEAADRRIEDPWLPRVLEWSRHPYRLEPGEHGRTHQEGWPMAAVTGVTTSEALEHIIGEDVDRMTHRDQIRMGALLKEVGWLPIGRQRPRRYRPVPVPAT
jgi:putative DNA primase/helicase